MTFGLIERKGDRGFERKGDRGFERREDRASERDGILRIRPFWRVGIGAHFQLWHWCVRCDEETDISAAIK
eukprot:927737-Amorphochlora_amoeboformis.AAC.1